MNRENIILEIEKLIEKLDDSDDIMKAILYVFLGSIQSERDRYLLENLIEFAKKESKLLLFEIAYIDELEVLNEAGIIK